MTLRDHLKVLMAVALIYITATLLFVLGSIAIHGEVALR